MPRHHANEHRQHYCPEYNLVHISILSSLVGQPMVMRSLLWESGKLLKHEQRFNLTMPSSGEQSKDENDDDRKRPVSSSSSQDQASNHNEASILEGTSSAEAPPLAAAAAAPIVAPATRRITPRPDDILCGRAFPYHMHPGNRRMYELVEENKPRYKSLDRSSKSEVVKEILRKLKKNGSRFLIRTDGRGTDINEGVWKVACRGDAYEKVCHALRGKSGKSSSSSSSDPPQPKPETNFRGPSSDSLMTSSIHSGIRPDQLGVAGPAVAVGGVPNTNLGVLGGLTPQQHGILNNLLPLYPGLLLMSSIHAASLQQNGNPAAAVAAATHVGDNPYLVNSQFTAASRASLPTQANNVTIEGDSPPEQGSADGSALLGPSGSNSIQVREPESVSSNTAETYNNGGSNDGISAEIAESVPPDTDPAILLALTEYLRKKRRDDS